MLGGHPKPHRSTGGFAAFAPFAASLAATIYAGAAFAVAGAVHVFQGFRDSEDRLWNIGFGLLGILLGLSFVINPLGGMMSLTIVLGILFLGSGLMQLYLAWKRRVKHAHIDRAQAQCDGAQAQMRWTYLPSTCPPKVW